MDSSRGVGKRCRGGGDATSHIQRERHFPSEVYLVALASFAAWEDLSTWLLPAGAVL